jgi:4-hydroxy-2-oxoheptanedioate aldolase
MTKIRDLRVDSLAIGAFHQTPSQVLAEGMGKAGFDWLCIDLQHGEIDWSNLLGVVQAMQLGDCDILVRVPWNDPVAIMRALDCGADGVVVPMVSTPEDAARAVAACRYGPRGIRSVGQTRRMFAPVGAYTATSAAHEPLCFVMLETAEGLENLAAIAATPDLDGILVGPGDLALSLGLSISVPPHERIAAAVKQTVEECRLNKIASATVAGVGGDVGTLVEIGMQMVAVGSEVGLAGAAARTVLSDTRATFAQVRG